MSSNNNEPTTSSETAGQDNEPNELTASAVIEPELSDEQKETRNALLAAIKTKADAAEDNE
jgi:hypothetical protein